MRMTVALFLLALVAGVLIPVGAGAPGLISYQGRLIGPGGSPVASATNLRFRIYLGGDDVSPVSGGVLVYDETAVVQPASTGVFSHNIGSGVPAAICDDGPCEMSAGDFGDGTVPVWIEVRVDPDGVPDNVDDDLMLPRTRVGTVGYAFQVGSLDGAQGGTLTGVVSADSLEGRTGATLGDGSGADVPLTFAGSTENPSITWVDGFSEFSISAESRFEAGLSVPLRKSVLFGPFDNPAEGASIRLNHEFSASADGNLDGVPDEDQAFSICYNCAEGASALEIPTEYGLAYRWVMTDAPADGQRTATHSWNFRSPAQPTYRPYNFYLDTDFAGGYVNPSAKWTFSTDRSTVALHINQNGNVMIGGNSPQPTYPLDVLGTIHTNEDVQMDAGRSVRFGTFSALEDDTLLGRLVLGNDYGAVRFGDGIGEMHLTFENLPLPARISWYPSFQEFRFNREASFDKGISLADLTTINYGPFTNPVPNTYIRYYKTHDSFSDGNLDGLPDQDHVVGICYNCSEGHSSGPQVTTEYAMRAQWEMTYAPVDGVRAVEHNWNFLAENETGYRPLLFYLDVDQAGGFANPTGKWTFMTTKNKVAFHINQNGNVQIGANSPQPQHQLVVRGNAYVEGSLILGSCMDIVASATVAIDDCSAVRLTGSSEVRYLNTCSSSDDGRMLVMMCGPDATTLCDGDGTRCAGGNLRLAGTDSDFVCTADDTMTLVCDGANWRQVSVSTN
jgi:hypothetical protein